MKSEENAEFGCFSPPAWCQWLISLSQTMPTRSWLGKRLAFLVRKPILLRQQTPIDTLSEGVKFRLFPKKNLSDKRLLCNPDLLDGIERSYFTNNLPKAAVVLDVGANIGGYGLLLASSRPDLEVFCIEADPQLAQRLKQHIKFNAFDERCHCLELAASATSGTVELFLDSVNQGRNSLVQDFVSSNNSSDKAGLSISVPSLTLGEIITNCSETRVDLLKMDIEGYEYPVLNQFFTSNDKKAWPEFIQLEQHRNLAFNDAVLLALDNGYSQVFQTRMNVILKKSS